MKRMIIFALLISGPCVAFAADGVMRTGCPSGYIRIEEGYHKLMDGVCVNGYRCLSFPVNTCLVDSPENVCYLFAERDVVYADTDGSKYKFSAMCPENGGTALSVYGAVKCVKLSMDMESIDVGPDSDFGVNNSVENTFLWNDTEIHMIGACSTDTGTIGNLDVMAPDMGNNCWCKMVAPASMQERRWVFSNEFDTPDDCLKSCAGMCLDSFSNSDAFRFGVILGSTLR